MIEFDNNEQGYLRWINAHPNGYVVNMPKDGRSWPNMLHRASCPHISTAHKNYTTTSYKKLCSESRAELEVSVRDATNGFQECKHCKP